MIKRETQDLNSFIRVDKLEDLSNDFYLKSSDKIFIMSNLTFYEVKNFSLPLEEDEIKISEELKIKKLITIGYKDDLIKLINDNKQELNSEITKKENIITRVNDINGESEDKVLTEKAGNILKKEISKTNYKIDNLKLHWDNIEYKPINTEIQYDSTKEQDLSNKLVNFSYVKSYVNSENYLNYFNKYSTKENVNSMKTECEQKINAIKYDIINLDYRNINNIPEVSNEIVDRDVLISSKPIYNLSLRFNNFERKFDSFSWYEIHNRPLPLNSSSLDKTDEISYITPKSLFLVKELIEAEIEKIKKKCPFEIGELYLTVDNRNPKDIWIGTEWVKIEKKFLLSTDNVLQSKKFGGSNSISLTIDNLPSHNHNVTLGNAGYHSHTLSPHNHDIPNHSHTFYISNNGGSNGGYLYAQNIRRGAAANTNITTTSSGGGKTSSNSSTVNSDGSHTHPANVSSVGNNKPINIIPEYFTVNMWYRTK